MGLADVYPPDALSVWDQPTFTTYALAAGTNTVVAKPNPNRVILWFSGDSVADFLLWFGPTPPAGAGLCLPPNTPVVVLRYHDDGPLLSQQWFATVISGVGTLSVMEATIARNPEMFGYDLFAQRKQVMTHHQLLAQLAKPKPRPPARRINPGVLTALQRRAPHLFGGDEGC